MRFNPFLCRREGPRRLSIVLGGIALFAWEAIFFGKLVPVYVWDQMTLSDVFGISLWAIGLPVVAYVLGLLPGAILWIIAGFRSSTSPGSNTAPENWPPGPPATTPATYVIDDPNDAGQSEPVNWPNSAQTANNETPERTS